MQPGLPQGQGLPGTIASASGENALNVPSSTMEGRLSPKAAVPAVSALKASAGVERSGSSATSNGAGTSASGIDPSSYLTAAEPQSSEPLGGAADTLVTSFNRDASLSGTAGGLTGILQGLASAPPKDRKLSTLRDASMAMSGFESGSGMAEAQGSGENFGHNSAVSNLQLGSTVGNIYSTQHQHQHGGDAADPPAVQASKIKKLAKMAKQGYRKVGVEKLPAAAADDNYDGQEDLASEFGQLFYPHGFRKLGERVYDAIRRWFTYFESEEALKKRTEMKQHGRLGKKFMENMNETISRNIYNAFLHDLYAQALRATMNWIALPLIFINAVSSALGALSLAPMGNTMYLGITCAQIVLGVIAAVLVAVQKFFQFAEKAAIHESIKQSYFEAVTAETLLIYDLSVDEITGMVVSSNGQPLKGDEIKLRLDKLYKTEKRLEGTPDEPVPEAVAGKLQPFVSKLQKEGYNGRWNLVSFPPVLGLKSYFLDVPQMSGCCSIVKNGVVRCQFGHDCQPINHDMPMDGWTMLCCGNPLWWNEGRNGRIHKTSARLTAENLAKMAKEKADQFKNNVPKGIKRWRKKALRKPKARPLGEGVEASGGAEMNELYDLEEGTAHSQLFPGKDFDAAHEAYVDHLERLDELEDELDALALEETRSMPPREEHVHAYLNMQYGHWLEHGSLVPTTSGFDSYSSSSDDDDGPNGPPAAPAAPAPSPPPPLSFVDGVYQPLPNGEGAPPVPSPFRLLGPIISPRVPFSGSEPATTPSWHLTSPALSPSLLRAPMPSPVSTQRRSGARPIAEALEVSPFETGQQQGMQEPLLYAPANATLAPGAEEDNGEGDEDSEEESIKPMSDVATEFGEAYYGPKFRLPGEKTKNAVVRFWRQHPDGTLAAYSARQDKRKTADKCKAFLRTITEAMSRNLYIAILHDLYAQRLKSKLNWIAMPLIFMNSVSAVLASTSLANLPPAVLAGMSLSTTGINVVAAVLVAMQKFFMFAEKAALHDAIKKAHYEAYTELSTLMVELTVDPDTKVIMDTSGMPISNDVITKKLVEMAHIEKKLEGTPDEPVPETIARQLQPYVSKLQDEGYDDRLALFRFPPVIGIRSYFLEVPEKTGLCSVVCDGVVKWQWGSSCQPVNHEVTQVGCELLCCGAPCIVCASDKSYEGLKAEAVFDQEVPRAVQPHVHTVPDTTVGKSLIDPPEQQAAMVRRKEGEEHAERTSKQQSRSSKEIAAVRGNQVVPEPASGLERASPIRLAHDTPLHEQELAQRK